MSHFAASLEKWHCGLGLRPSVSRGLLAHRSPPTPPQARMWSEAPQTPSCQCFCTLALLFSETRHRGRSAVSIFLWKLRVQSLATTRCPRLDSWWVYAMLHGQSLCCMNAERPNIQEYRPGKLETISTTVLPTPAKRAGGLYKLPARGALCESGKHHRDLSKICAYRGMRGSHRPRADVSRDRWIQSPRDKLIGPASRDRWIQSPGR